MNVCKAVWIATWHMPQCCDLGSSSFETNLGVPAQNPFVHSRRQTEIHTNTHTSAAFFLLFQLLIALHHIGAMPSRTEL